MEKSESENESDCYESAEEELEKNDKVVNEKLSVNITVPESESDGSTAVASFQNANAKNSGVTVPRKEEPKEASKNTVSYRKRPERVRRLDSIPSAKKEFSKLDILSPDVLIQDITLNLSKNINKSLNTIQQTSSSVKDLILNSLPVSNVNEKSGFSYDDKEKMFANIETKCEGFNSPKSEPKSNELVKCLSQDNFTSEEGLKIMKSLEEEINNIMENPEVDVHEESSDGFILNKTIVSDISDNIKENCDIVVDKIKNKTVKECVDEKINSDIHIPSKEVSLVDNEQESDILAKEIIDDKPEIVGENSNSSDDLSKSSANILDISKDRNLTSDSNSPPLSKNASEKEITENKIGANSFLTRNKSDDWNDSPENSISNEGNDSWIKGDWDDFAEEPDENETEKEKKEPLGKENIKNNIEANEEKAQAFECDLESLKTSLEKIVLQNDDENQRETKLSKQEFSEHQAVLNVEKEETNQEGWDDFDFSDNEIDNQIKSTDLEKPLANNDPVKSAKKVTKLAKDSKSPQKKVSKAAEEKIKKKPVEAKIKVEKTEAKSQAKSKQILNDAKKLEKSKIEGSSKSEVKDSKEPENDNWEEWENWGDEAENKIQEKTEPSGEETLKNDVEKNEFEEKWSGWDNFAQKQDEKQGNWNLGSWGVNMLINKASAVTQGISTVLEAGLGAPDPETLARMEKDKKIDNPEEENIEKKEEDSQRELSPKRSSSDTGIFPVFELSSLVAGVTSKIVEHSKIQEIGSKVISGGLDTLESFGKKTMEVLQEGDPGLKKKRALWMGSNKPVLSQVLREAREKAESQDKRIEEKELLRKCHFETLFDDYQGMIHLEALEMLSTQCELKLEQLRSSLSVVEQEDMDGILQEVEQLCCLEDFYLDWDNFKNVDFKISIQIAVESLQQEISLVKLLQVHDQVDQWLMGATVSKPSGLVIHQKVVSTLAELTAATVHQFHKTGELLSVKECRKTVEEVDALLKMTNVLCAELDRLCERFRTLCEKLPGEDSIIEKIDLVHKNAVNYIKQAFNLLIPIIQVGAAM